jgi:hypothetical protein
MEISLIIKKKEFDISLSFLFNRKVRKGAIAQSSYCKARKELIYRF